MRPVLCLVTSRRAWGDRWREAVPAQVARAARDGVALVQVREPDLEAGALYELVRRCVDAVRGTPARVLVNDRLDVALAARAHGVHLRSRSMEEARVRARCPRPFLIGRSIHSADEAARATPALDYLIFGTVFASPSKPDVAPAGVHGLAQVVRATVLPVLAIGGITLTRMPDVLQTGAAGVAGITLFTKS